MRILPPARVRKPTPAKSMITFKTRQHHRSPKLRSSLQKAVYGTWNGMMEIGNATKLLPPFFRRKERTSRSLAIVIQQPTKRNSPKSSSKTLPRKSISYLPTGLRLEIFLATFPTMNPCARTSSHAPPTHLTRPKQLHQRPFTLNTKRTISTSTQPSRRCPAADAAST